MPLTSTDWIVIVGDLLVNLLIGLYYRRRASGNTEEFFISGRDVSWWLAGTSMVATTFAADTPLLVCGLVARQGIAALDLVGIMHRRHDDGLLFRALLAAGRGFDRRSISRASLRGKAGGISARIQSRLSRTFYELLHPGMGDTGHGEHHYGAARPAIAQGRAFAAVDWRTHFSAHARRSALHVGDDLHIILIPFTGLYTFIGGLWGVLVTDLFQFALKMAMIIVLASVAVAKIGGMQALQMHLQVIENNVRATGVQTANPVALLPDFHLGLTTDALWTLPVLTFIVYWECSGGWRGIQGPSRAAADTWRSECSAPKVEKNSLGATCGSTSRITRYGPGPGWLPGWWRWWFIRRMAGLHPSAAFVQNPEQGYVMVLRDYLPPALRGLMVAAFLAAFMSTIGTQLNWGSSYLVNDLYKRFFVRGADRETLRHDQQDFYGAVGLGQRIHRDAVDVDQSGLAIGFEYRLRDWRGLHLALVLVAH